MLPLLSKPSQCSITFPVINAVYPTKPLPAPIFLYLYSSCFRWLMFLDLQGLPTCFFLKFRRSPDHRNKQAPVGRAHLAYALLVTREEGGSSIDTIYNISPLLLSSFPLFFITFLSLSFEIPCCLCFLNKAGILRLCVATLLLTLTCYRQYKILTLSVLVATVIETSTLFSSYENNHKSPCPYNHLMSVS